MIFHQPHNSLSNYNYNAVFYTDKIWNFHFHKNLELIFVIEGSVRCTINDVEYTLSVGDFGLCLPYDIHSYEPSENTLYWVLVFSEDYVRSVSKDLSGKISNGFSFRCNKTVEDYIKKQLIFNKTLSTLTLKSCLYAVCEQYLSNVQLVKQDKKKYEIVSSIADYISQNHINKISLSDIASRLGYDYNYMSRYFRKIFNMSFTDFVNIYRLETAIQLLEDTEKSIADIAFESGFQSVRNFNNFFKTSTGKSPTEYKKHIRK